VIIFVIGIPGILAALVTLLPRVSVSIGDPPDLDNAFSALATVTNSGYIPLDSVGVLTGVGEVCTRGSPCYGSALAFPNPMRDYVTRFKTLGLVPERYMALDDHFTFALDDIMYARDKGGLAYADIAIVIQYRVPYLPWTREKTFPLYTRKASNGKLYWQWK